MPMTDALVLFVAVVMAAIGGDLFLRGVVQTAAWLRLPPALIATTLSAAATSSPELSVSVMAATAAQPGIGLGDALGSNVVNIGLGMGLGLLFGALDAPWKDIRRELIFALFVPMITLMLLLDGQLSRADGAVLLVLFALWITLGARQAMQHRKTSVNETQTLASPWRATLSFLVGLLLLVTAGRLFVSGASGIAAALGLSNYVIGATLVAVGTSLPELVTVLLSRRRGQHDIGLGTVLGSNLFNGLVIVGTAASIHPIVVSPLDVAPALIIGLLTLLLILPRKDRIPQERAWLLIGAYAVFAGLTLA